MNINVTLEINTDYFYEAQNDVRTLMKLVGIEEAKPATPFSVTPETLLNLFTALRMNQKIQAIKAVREMTGMGLTESKAFVENYYFGPPTGY